MANKLFISTKIFLGDLIERNFINGGIVVNTETGKIIQILRTPSEVIEYREQNLHIQLYELNDKILMPGLIDSHVHINDPGREDWEGFVTATKAAATGGFTTLVDMPLNSLPPTTTLKNLHIKMDVARDKIYVDVGFWGGIIPNNADEIPKMIVDGGVVGFKGFLCSSGVDEFPKVTKQDVEKALKKMQNLQTVLAFHAEVDEADCEIVDCSNDEDPTKFETYLKTRPYELELSAIRMISEFCDQSNVQMHIVHLSSFKSLDLIKQIQQKHPNQLTVETCHHYLCLDSNLVPDKHTEFKCCPPIRNEINQINLWKAIKNHEINLIVSDHSPSTPEMKLLIHGMNNYGNFLKAWGGISSVQFGLSLFWTYCQQYELNIHDMHRLMCQNPAKLCGFQNRKSQITEGFDADFCIWDPNDEFTITMNDIQFKNKFTPYIDMKLKGVVHMTVVGGNIVYEKDIGCQGPFGKCLLRNENRI